jgi:secreted Zn-dependent insulinase-like peptidase
VEKRDVAEVNAIAILTDVPDRLTTIHSQPAKRPRLIKQTSLGSVWHKKDDQFWLPKASVVLELRRYALGLTRILKLVLIINIVKLLARLRVLIP